jgi:hypothetical protein
LSPKSHALRRSSAIITFGDRSPTRVSAVHKQVTPVTGGSAARLRAFRFQELLPECLLSNDQPRDIVIVSFDAQTDCGKIWQPSEEIDSRQLCNGEKVLKLADVITRYLSAARSLLVNAFATFNFDHRASIGWHAATGVYCFAGKWAQRKPC